MLKEKGRLLVPWIILIFYVFTCGIVLLSFLINVNVDVFVEFFNEISLVVYTIGIAIAVIYDKRIKCSDIILLGGMGVYFVVSTIINSGGLGSVLSLILPFILLCCFEYSEFDELFVYITVCAGVFMSLACLLVSKYVFTEYMSWILENTTNPNTVGFLTVIFFMLWCSFVELNSNYKKLFFVAFALVCLICLINVRARTALIAFVVYCLLLFFPKKFLSKRLMAFLFLFIVALGLLIPVVYVNLYQSGIELKFFGKDLFTGREVVWQEMFKNLSEKGIFGWLYGVGSHVLLSDGSLALHNDYFSIIYNFGIFGLVFVIAFFALKLKPVLNSIDDIRIRKLTYSFACIWVISFFETLFISSFLYVFVCFGLGFAMNLSKVKQNGEFVDDKIIADRLFGKKKDIIDFVGLKKIKAVFHLLIQKLTPVKKDTIVFTSFNGHYADSPKYISQKIHELDQELKLVWIVEKKYLNDLPDYVIGVDINDDKQRNKYLSTARSLVDNVYAGKEVALCSTGFLQKYTYKFISWLKIKKHQLVFTTWHGTPLKRMGRDQIGNNVYDFSCPNTTMILGNKFTHDIMKRLTFDKIKMELIGCPRNDILFERGKERLYKEKLGLPIDKKIALFAPTFRNDGKDCQGKNVMRSGINQLEEMDIDKLLTSLYNKFGGEWIMVCRFHYHVEKMVDWDKLCEKYNGRIINGNIYDDMAEYLVASDLLITDASSSMFDYVHTEKPCFLYFPDLENYKNNERGFYVDIEELPFPCSGDFNGLLMEIDKFDFEKYQKGIVQLKDRFGFVDSDNSSEEIAKYIIMETRSN